MVDEKESESDCGIADSCYESDSDSHAKVTSSSITRIEINTLDGTNRMCIIYFIIYILQIILKINFVHHKNV